MCRIFFWEEECEGRDGLAKGKIGRDTCILSGIQLLLQGMGLLLNIFLTRRLGGSAVGMVSLIGTFYCLCAVLASGNSFVASSRFVSEEIGREDGNPNRMLRYALLFCLVLSMTVGIGVCLLAPTLAARVLRAPETVTAIRLLAMTLPLAALSACLKGYFHAYRRIMLPAVSDTIEFLLRAGVLAFCVCFLIPQGRCSIFSAIALSMLIGQLSAFLLLFLAYRKNRKPCSNPCRMRPWHYVAAVLPLLCNSYVTSILSSANDALIPLTLKQFGSSTAEALSQFGVFEAILLPALFFPAVALSCLSCILVPELSRERAGHREQQVQHLIGTVLQQTLAFSAYIVLLLLLFGDEIGVLIGGDAFAGRMLTLLAPVVPFIYLEIVLEGILRGLGRQNFSSVNYIAEYLIRISVLLVCVPMFGFYGMIASYYASNVVGNIVRFFMVFRLSDTPLPWKRFFLRPFCGIVAAWQVSSAICRLLCLFGMPTRLFPFGFALVCGGVYWFLLRVLDNLAQGQTSRLAANTI